MWADGAPGDGDADCVGYLHLGSADKTMRGGGEERGAATAGEEMRCICSDGIITGEECNIHPTGYKRLARHIRQQSGFFFFF